MNSHQVIGYLHGKGTSAPTDATDTQLFSALDNLIQPPGDDHWDKIKDFAILKGAVAADAPDDALLKVLMNSLTGPASPTPTLANANDAMTYNDDYSGHNKAQVDTIYADKLQQETAKNGGNVVRAHATVKNLNPGLMNRKSVLSAQTLNAASASAAPKTSPVLIPSPENIAALGLQAPSLEEFTAAAKAAGSFDQPDFEGAFGAVQGLKMAGDGLDARAAAAAVTSAHPMLAARANAQKCAAALGTTLPKSNAGFVPPAALPTGPAAPDFNKPVPVNTSQSGLGVFQGRALNV